MNHHEKINYVEFPASDLLATKQFFEDAFSWSFEDFGPDYSAFSNAGIDGGFFRSDLCSRTDNGSALVVFYSDNLEVTKEKVEAVGGRIVAEIFPFPGGRRFQFLDPSGNEFGVWSDQDSR